MKATFFVSGFVWPNRVVFRPEIWPIFCPEILIHDFNKFDFKFNYSILNSEFNHQLNGKPIYIEDVMKLEEAIRQGGKLHLRTTISIISPDVNDLSAMADSSLRKLDLGINVVENHTKPEDVIFEMITSLPESDVLIKTDDGMTHRAHKSVLSEKSAVFNSMFTIDMEEAANNSVDIIEFKGPVMKELIRFIYFGKVNNIEKMNVELFKAAKTYEIANLSELCLKSIIDVGITHKNVIEVVELAHVYDIHQLFDHCCEKIQM